MKSNKNLKDHLNYPLKYPLTVHHCVACKNHYAHFQFIFANYIYDDYEAKWKNKFSNTLRTESPICFHLSKNPTACSEFFHSIKILIAQPFQTIHPSCLTFPRPKWKKNILFQEFEATPSVHDLRKTFARTRFAFRMHFWKWCAFLTRFPELTKTLQTSERIIPWILSLKLKVISLVLLKFYLQYVLMPILVNYSSFSFNWWPKTESTYFDFELTNFGDALFEICWIFQ